ncbi:hypothetical protein [Oscillibacter sp.]|uniref:hypothetical protein n=1 Tax=Oscillibacter sp. TaxID=1945593 RepID=UPI0028983FD1|nr:hypothetical protein [Oscillibacter sp.]
MDTPTGPAVDLAGAQYADVCPRERAERIYVSDKTIKFNTEITNGAPYINYDPAEGTFVISRPGKYVINLMLFVANIIDGNKTQIILEMNGAIVVCHDVVLSSCAFKDVILVNREKSELCVLNSGEKSNLLN